MLKKVLTNPYNGSDGTFYIRVGSQSAPISRDFLRDMFLTRDFKRQKYLRLVYEREYIYDLIKSDDQIYNSLPQYHALRIEELQKAVMEYVGYFKPGAQDHIKNINKHLRDLKRQKQLFQLSIDIILKEHYGQNWTSFDSFIQHACSKANFFNYNSLIFSTLNNLKSELDELWKYI